MSDPKNEDRQVVYVTRLNPVIYQALAKRLPAPLVTERTTDLQAGYQLGVQAVLSLLREDLIQGE